MANWREKMKMTEEEIQDIMKLALDALTVSGEGNGGGRGTGMKLYIIRHGQTDWNVAGKIQGRQTSPNETGRQAACLAKGMERGR